MHKLFLRESILFIEDDYVLVGGGRGFALRYDPPTFEGHFVGPR
jgi:hypothetical protein